jgi:hypothetical protein
MFRIRIEENVDRKYEASFWEFIKVSVTVDQVMGSESSARVE